MFFLSSAPRVGQLAGVQFRSVVASARFASSKEHRLQKTNWEHDKVYLYQFPRTPYLLNLSPFCLKVETFLRVNGINHEIMSTTFLRSVNGKLPFIELNGEQIADSQIILWRLAKQFEIEDPVKAADRGVARAVERMLDCSTFSALNLDKVVNNSQLMLSRNVSGLPLPAFATNFLAAKMKSRMERRLKNQFDRLSHKEIKEILRRDVQALSDILDQKKFLFGDRMTVADCTAFAHLATTYYLPFRQQISELIDDEHPNIKTYLNRIRVHYFQDWKLKEY